LGHHQTMKEGPDIAKTAAMMGDPARSNMLMALMSGMALTSNELAREAGITPSTASGHLSQLEESGLVTGRKQGRYRYYKLANVDVAHAVEALVTVAARAGHLRTRPGPKNDAMREARTCYDHIAGRAAVELFERWLESGMLQWKGSEVCVSQSGREKLGQIGIDVRQMEHLRRPLCRTCIDWSERRHHLGGSIGAAVLSKVIEHGWASRVESSRTIRFRRGGEQLFVAWSSGQASHDGRRT
jgi:DNA-binding transcriptional ArsR family regulator